MTRHLDYKQVVTQNHNYKSFSNNFLVHSWKMRRKNKPLSLKLYVVMSLFSSDLIINRSTPYKQNSYLIGRFSVHRGFFFRPWTKLELNILTNRLIAFKYCAKCDQAFLFFQKISHIIFLYRRLNENSSLLFI